MPNIRKLSAFRQLSLHCESPPPEITIKLHDHRRPIKIAWADDLEPISPKNDGVIVKKCIKEVKKTAKLTRHSSLEKDSILYMKPELTERLRNAINKEKEQEKPNLNIFLAQDYRENYRDDPYGELTDPEPPPPRIVPKIMPTLITPGSITNTKNVFQIRKSKELSYASAKANAIVVVPLVENGSPPSTDRSASKADPKAIKNVIIRPSTAAAKRERFQKRTNSAFNSIVKDVAREPTMHRPPLVRSSSAPTSKSDTKLKFFATKRRVKQCKRRDFRNDGDENGCNKENPKSKKEMNRYVPVNGSDIETMVSLISPAASDTDEIEIEKPVKPKCSPRKVVIKSEEKECVKNVSLRKTVKSVSFQQSSIHAIRSFSASFPGRRSSMATALMLGSNLQMKNTKTLEKRSTNSTSLDDDERVPKRRLVRSATDTPQKCEEDSNFPENDSIDLTPKTEITINIKTKTISDTTDLGQETSSVCNTNQTSLESPIESVDVYEEEQTSKALVESEVVGNKDDGPQFGTVKEKQCWDMFCKMTNKGLKVSYDTILRGLLTPTEYRMRRKESVVENDVGNGEVAITSSINK